MYKKFDFKFPEKPPSLLQRMKFTVVRADNNLKYGFDGDANLLQIGGLVDKAPSLQSHEVVIQKLVRDGNLIKTIVGNVVNGRKLIDTGGG
jgi:hypothetical protein